MKEEIEKIIAIEQNAKRIIKEAKVDKEKKEVEHEKRVEEMRAHVIGDAYKKVENIRERELKETGHLIAQKDEECNEKIQQIQKDAELMKAEWLDKLYTKVTKQG